MSIPGKVVAIKKRIATIETNSEKIELDLGLNDDIDIDDYILYSSERIIKKISKEDFEEISKLL